MSNNRFVFCTDITKIICPSVVDAFNGIAALANNVMYIVFKNEPTINF